MSNVKGSKKFLNVYDAQRDSEKESMVIYRFAKELELLGIPFSLEKVLFTDSPNPHFNICRVDLAYFYPDGTLKGIVEFKGYRTTFKDDKARRRSWRQTRQGRKYPLLGVPVHLVISPESFKSALAKIRSEKRQKVDVYLSPQSDQ